MDQSRHGPDDLTLAVIVPTRNEAGNVGPLVTSLQEALQGISAEVIFVDDSDDETPSEIAKVAQSAAIRGGTHLARPRRA